MSICVNIQI